MFAGDDVSWPVGTAGNSQRLGSLESLFQPQCCLPLGPQAPFSPQGPRESPLGVAGSPTGPGLKTIRVTDTHQAWDPKSSVSLWLSLDGSVWPGFVVHLTDGYGPVPRAPESEAGIQVGR